MLSTIVARHTQYMLTSPISVRAASPPPIMREYLTPQRGCIQVVFVNPGNTDMSLDRKQRVRAMWYVILAGLEDVETQRRGCCFVVSQKTSKFSQVCFVSFAGGGGAWYHMDGARSMRVLLR